MDPVVMRWQCVRFAAGVLCLTLLLSPLVACSGGNDADAVPPPPAPTRSYLLSATAVQAVAGGQPFYQYTPAGFSAAALAADTDVVSVVVEHYGLPWDDFAAAATPPDVHPWTQTMRRFADAARATGKPVMLQLVLSRDRLAANARAQGADLVIDSGWQPPCFDFSSGSDGPRYRQAFRRYVAWMVELFAPAYLVHAVEVSTYRRVCGPGARWQALIDTANEAFDAAKALRPAMPVFPSFVLGEVYGNDVAGFDTAFFAQFDGLRRDRLGLSVYPQGLRGATAGALPTDFFSRIRQQRPTEPRIIVTETGWNSDDLRVGTPAQCTTALASSEAAALDYLSQLLARAQADGIELVTWWSTRDLLPAAVMAACYPTAVATSVPPFAACDTDPWCPAVNVFRASDSANPTAGEIVFKAFGTMGLRRYDGTPKAALLQRWEAARAMPYRAP
jgi:hypothetical protein